MSINVSVNHRKQIPTPSYYQFNLDDFHELKAVFEDCVVTYIFQREPLKTFEARKRRINGFKDPGAVDVLQQSRFFGMSRRRSTLTVVMEDYDIDSPDPAAAWKTGGRKLPFDADLLEGVAQGVHTFSQIDTDTFKAALEAMHNEVYHGIMVEVAHIPPVLPKRRHRDPWLPLEPPSNTYNEDDEA